MASLWCMARTRSRRADVARTAAAAGLLSSWVSPAVSEPSASSRSRWPITSLEARMPRNSPSSRCTAIGNHSRTSAANAAPGSANNRQSVTATNVAE